MKPITMLLALSFGFSLAWSQDTTEVAQSPIVENMEGPVLSSNPPASELAELFKSHDASSKDAVRRVVERGSGAVDGLVELLLSPTDRWKDISDPMASLPNKLLAVDALARLKSVNGFLALARAAETGPDKEIRGRALYSLAVDYHAAVSKGEIEPTKSIVLAFISNLGNETLVGSIQKTLGQISQEGIVKWLGLDFGDPIFEKERLAASGGGEDIGAIRFAALWWQENSEKLRWNSETHHFEVTP
ncbi:MAG: hypothetical protein HRF40_14660 [Nitrososphaera sp.]|jgi:hypothetical protein